MDKDILFSLRNISKTFLRNRVGNRIKTHPAKIDVKRISLSFNKSESFGLTGARSSGAATIAEILGKSTLPDSGEILWEDNSLNNLSKEERLRFQNKVKIVSPVELGLTKKVKTAADYIKDVLKQIHQLSEEYENNMTNELLKSVGLDPEIGLKHLYQLNDTQLQHVIVARALATSPKYLVADQLSFQSNSQVKRALYDILLKIKHRLGIGLVLIDSDIANLCNYTDRIGIMLYGRLVEVGMTDEIINSPMHPYTKRIVELSNQRTSLNDFDLDEDIVDNFAPSGCPYAKDCKRSEVKCRLIEPELIPIGNGRNVACHNIEEEEHTVVETAATGFGMVV